MNALNKELVEQFVSLACGLSPENLTCDGELSREQVNARYNKLMTEWRRLEKVAGRKVTEDEIWKSI